MLYFLLRVTGIPATEEQALRTKGDDYRDYQRRTSMFIPWFEKSGLLLNQEVSCEHGIDSR
jgi:steroid 5-alpha reductase family enzyme